MELVVTIDRVSTSSRDIHVSVDDTATLQELAARLATEVAPHYTNAAFNCGRLGGLLPSELRCVSSGLLQGDRVHLVDVASASQARIVGGTEHAAGFLVVVRGPDTGKWFALHAGEQIVGRTDAEADVALTDPTISRRHFAIAIGALVEISSTGATNPTVVDGTELESTVTAESGATITSGDTTAVLVKNVLGFDGVGSGSVGYNRPPRFEHAFEPTVVKIPEPPILGRPPRFPWLSAMMPLTMIVPLVLVMTLTHQPLASGLMFMLFFFMSPLFAFGSWKEQKRTQLEDFELAKQDWTASFIEITVRVEDAVADEQVRRRASGPDREACRVAVERRSLPLWSRAPRDFDFGSLRLGSCAQPSMVSLELPEGGDKALRTRAMALAKRHRLAPDVPLIVADRTVSLTALCGPATLTAGVARWLLWQSAVLHAPTDLVIAALVPHDDQASWDWLKWLPHTNAQTSPLRRLHLASSQAGAAMLLEDLQQLALDRAPDNDAVPNRPPHVLVLIDDRVTCPRPALARFIETIPGTSISVIWIGRSRSLLPSGSDVVAEVADDGQNVHVEFMRAGMDFDTTFESMTEELARTTARLLAPLKDISARGVEADVPASVSITQLLGGPEILDDPAKILERWEHGDALNAPIGLTGSGEMSIDLRARGPHGLVAGTTGAGKSELLQTIIASMSATFSPKDVNFLLIDYKGGAAFRECAEFPHVVAFVTDLEGAYTQRALISLNAEIRRREELLHKARAKDLIDMEKSRHPDTPPNLILIVDEFAALAKEVPDFVEGVVDVAQRGRSLGIHMILATQRPTGVVTPSIQANTALRISLRVAPGESADVIGTNDAEHIAQSAPGRAYSRVGASRPSQFQAGYVGGISGGDGHKAMMRISDRTFEGYERWRELDTGNSENEEQPTDLMRLVATVREAFVEAKLPTPHVPLKDLLADCIGLEELAVPDHTGTAVLGQIDDPAKQDQYPALYDPSTDGNLLVLGAASSGKTTALRTIAASLALRCGAEQLHIYGIDSTRALDLIAPLPQVGSVIRTDDAERVQRLLRELRTTSEQRAETFAQATTGTLDEYNLAVPVDQRLPRIIVFLDGLAEFTAEYDRAGFYAVEESLARLAASGQTFGIHFVFTADVYRSVPRSLQGTIRRKLVLRLANADEYLAVDRQATKTDLKAPSGRGYLDDMEIQVAIAGGSPEGVAQAGAMDALAAMATRRFGDSRATPIRSLETVIDGTAAPAASDWLQPVIGVRDIDFSWRQISLVETSLVITGRRGAGKTNALAMLARSARGQAPNTRMILLNGRRPELDDIVPWTHTAKGNDAITDLIERLQQELDDVVSSGAAIAPLLIVADDYQELQESSADEALQAFMRAGRDHQIRIALTTEPEVAVRAYGGVVSVLRREGTFLFLAPKGDDGDAIDVALPVGKQRFATGRGFVCERNKEPDLVQVGLLAL